MHNLIVIKSALFKGILAVFLFIILVVSAFAEVENVDNQKLQLLMAEGIPIVDIRQQVEWKETGIVPGSHLITFFNSDGKYDVEKWLSKLAKITSRNEPLIIICRSGRRSLIVANYLSNNEKFLKVYNVGAGIKGWKQDNLEILIFQ